MLSFSFLPSKVVKTDPIAVNNGRGVGVGCMVQGLDGNMWGKVVRDGGHEWILQSAGRVAAKGDELVRWRWMPSSQPSALGRSRRKGKVGAAATAVAAGGRDEGAGGGNQWERHRSQRAGCGCGCERAAERKHEAASGGRSVDLDPCGSR